MRNRFSKVILLSLVYVTLLFSHAFAGYHIVEGKMVFSTSTYGITPVTKWGFASLAGNAYKHKTVSSCVGACSSSEWQRAYQVKANHAGFIWNVHYAFYDFY